MAAAAACRQLHCGGSGRANVVGRYRNRGCLRTPDVLDARTNRLYDTTVDKPDNPSIYVTCHDAQAYPEYLLEFSQP